MKELRRKQDTPPDLLKKTYSVERIKESIPLIENLHPSFWDEPEFLTWQIVRLNRDYQKFIVHLWGNIHLWGDVDSLNFLSVDYLPLFQESIDDWKAKERFAEYNLRYFERFPFFISGRYKEFFNSLPNYFKVRFAPIPHSVRFPLPILLNIFPYLKVGRRYFKLKGRPQDWGRNLLVYELSQAGMKNMEIARLLFGVEKWTERWPDKHPILVRIDAIKKTVEKAISQSSLSLFPT